MTSLHSVASWKPRSYQKDGVKLMLKQACAGLLYKPGLGKTSVVYMAVRILLEKQYVSRVLVICPVRPLYNVWPNQKNDYAEFQHLRVGLLHGKEKENVLASDDYDIYVINPEGLPWLFNATVKKNTVFLDPVRLKWLQSKFDMLVVDESTKFKNTQTQRFKLLRAFIGKFKRRYILTGTPMPRSLEDLFGQIYILDEGANLGRFITHYRNQYFYPDPSGFDWNPQPGAKERVLEKIAPLVQVVEPKGNIELPEIIYNDIFVTLPSDVYRQYSNMEDMLVAAVDEDRVVAANAAVASGKCRQIANGAIYGENGEYKLLHTEKYDAVSELIDQLQGEPLLICYEFDFDRAQLEKQNIPCISSGNARRDNEYISKFSRGELVAVMGNPASIALGTDGLQKNCYNIAMVGVTWKAQDYEQVIDRVRRVGNKSKQVIVHRILARDTVDELVVRVVPGRMADQESLMKMLKEMRRGKHL